MSLIVAQANRGITKDLTILNASSVAIIPGANDLIRAVIGRTADIDANLTGALLTVVSNAPTANGSSFTKNSPSSGVNRLRLDASDLVFDPGIYTLFIDFYDYADATEWKTCDRLVFVLE